MLRIVIDEARGRVPVIAGSGSAATAHCIELSKVAHKLKVDGLLVVVPYYLQARPRPGSSRTTAPSHKAVPLPIVLYNIPGSLRGRSRCFRRSSIIAEICRAWSRSKRPPATCSEAPEIVRQLRLIASACCPAMTALTLPIMAVGGHGVISVASNVAPREVEPAGGICSAPEISAARALSINACCRCTRRSSWRRTLAREARARSARHDHAGNSLAVRAARAWWRFGAAYSQRTYTTGAVMTRVSVHGTAGRMGRNITKLLVEDKGATLVSAIERAGSPAIGQDVAVLNGFSEPLGVVVTASLESALERAEVVIDFSLPVAARALFEACAARKVAVVVGTTGLDAAAAAALDCTRQSGARSRGSELQRRRKRSLGDQRRAGRARARA